MTKPDPRLPGFHTEHSFLTRNVCGPQRERSGFRTDLRVYPSQIILDSPAGDFARCFEFYYTCDYFPIIKVTEAGPVVVGQQPYNCRADARYIC